MRITDTLRSAASAFRSTIGWSMEEQVKPGMKGEIFLTIENADGSVEKRHVKNLIVSDASILIARLVKDSVEAPHGAFCLAVGSGAVGWNPMHPPAQTITQRALYSELGRKRFASTAFVNGSGTPVAYPTHVVDFTTVFTQSEAVGPWVEMGLIGGNVSSNMSVRNPVSPPNGTYDPTVDLTAYETLINYITFPVINKPATSTFSLTWRLTF